MTLKVTSSAFEEGGPIPAQYTCEGEDSSPPLSWSGVPTKAKTLALIVDDPDAPDPAVLAGGFDSNYAEICQLWRKAFFLCNQLRTDINDVTASAA